MTTPDARAAADIQPMIEPIAVVGMACRVPGAGDVQQYWRNLAGGVESVRFSTREEQAGLGVPGSWLNDPNFVPAAAPLDDHDQFDAAFFAMSAREAELRDPQHRVFLELSYNALEDAGHDPGRYPGEIGVYGGIGAADYHWRNIRRNAEALAAAGPDLLVVSNHSDYLATFTSYKLDLRGPSLTLHTACSSSLVAIHVACEALRSGECDMALGGGVTIDLPARWGYVHEQDGILSPDGHCRAFDALAAGTLWGSGGGVVVLKRLGDALADGDHIRAVVLGNAINNDGAAKVGFSAPSQEGQAAAIAQALDIAGVDPRTITYVEAHGTGTALGDPIEVAALSSVFSRDTAERGWCAIGSVKPNIGHLGQSSGVASLVKTILALQHRLIPASLHFEKPNPKIDFAGSPFYVNTGPARWETDRLPRRAGVSSFGLGGTNVHVLLEEAPAQDQPPRPAQPAHLLQLSARTETALATSADRLAEHLARHPESDLADVAHTLRTGRRELPRRGAVVVRDIADARVALRDPKRLITGMGARPPRVAFLFSGQGAQYPGMGAELYGAAREFREAVDLCAELLRAEMGEDLRDLLLAGGDAEQKLRQTAYTQPVLFTVEYALARLWGSWGVEPAAMIGHSVGEYVAATLAGVFALPDALRVVATRGRLMQGLPPGEMLAVRLAETEIAGLLPDGVSVAAVNAPGSCVVAGPADLVGELADRLAAEGVIANRLRTSHAFHSPMMEPILAEFREVVAAVERRAPKLPMLSNLTGEWITAAEATDPTRWARQLREPVRFGACVRTLAAENGWALVECGPGRQLSRLARAQLPEQAMAPLPSLPGPDDAQSDVEVLYAAAGGLWTSGVAVDTEKLGPVGRKVPLPTYPWERKRYWIEADPDAGGVPRALEKPDTGPLALDDWFAAPTWRQAVPAVVERVVPDRCLAFVDGRLSKEVASALSGAGAECLQVRPGDRFRRDGEGYTVRPGERADYDALLSDLEAGGEAPSRIVHAWTLDTPQSVEGTAADRVWHAQDRGFFSLLWLTQALAATRPAERVQVDVLTRGVHDVTGHDLVHPEHATVAGIVKVVPFEATWLTVRHVDLDPSGDPSLGASRAVAELLRPAADAVALRGGRRWLQEYEQLKVQGPADPAAVLREGGVYLVTGGLGGIGITLAEHLAQRVRARLVLLSRSGSAAGGTTDRERRAIAAIQRMEAAGADVLTLAADVTCASDLRRVRRQVLDRFGRVDGIVHAAGLPGGGMAEVKDRAVAEEVLAPKLRGSLELFDAFGDLPVDFVVLCSSITAITGGFGQVDYCAANNFLDAYARGGHGWQGRVLSVNWGGWREVGMAAERTDHSAFRALQRGERTEPIDHPILTTRHLSDGDSLPWFSGRISPSTHWMLDEHRMSGVPLLPGAGYMDSVLRAAEQALGPPPQDGDHLVELQDIAFVEPLRVADGTAADLRIVFEHGAEGLDFEVRTDIGGQVRAHARGSVAWTPAGPQTTADVPAILTRCPAEQEPGHLLPGLLDLGPRWQVPARAYLGEDEAMGLLEAPGVIAAELGQWVLHPSFLDEATSFARTGRGGEGAYLPLGYGRLVARGSLPPRMWSHVRYRDGGGGEVIAADIALLDEEGHEVVTIEDFVLRRLTPERVQELAQASDGVRSPEPAPRIPEAAAYASGISPDAGAEAFLRLLGPDLGAQVVVNPIPVHRALRAVRRVTDETLAAEPDSVASTQRTVRADDESYVPPRTDAEQRIAGLWRELLGVDRVGVEDDFFDLGGDSLVAVQLLAMMRKSMDVRLPMRSLFEAPTVAGLAALAERPG